MSLNYHEVFEKGTKKQQIEELIVDAFIVSLNYGTPLTEEGILKFVNKHIERFQATKNDVRKSKNFISLKNKGKIQWPA